MNANFQAPVREQATKESDLQFDEPADDDDYDNDWSGDVEWTEQDDDGGDGDFADESTAYIDFLNREVRNNRKHFTLIWR